MSDDFVPVSGRDRIKAVRDAALRFVTEPTFRCPVCCDTRFVTRSDSHGRVYGARCDCLLDEIANKPKVEALKFRGIVRERPIDDDEGLPF